MAVFQYGYRMMCIMLWKSWRVRRRHWIRTLIEIAAPVFLVLLLVSVKAVMEPDDAEDTSKPIHFIAHDMRYLVRQICHVDCETDAARTILAYAPNNDTNHHFVNNLMKEVHHIFKKSSPSSAKLEIQGFESEAEIGAFNAMLGANNGLDKTKVHPVLTKMVGAVVFVKHPRRVNSRSGDLVYKIRLIDTKFITGKAFADMQFPGPGKHHRVYENSGFLGLQLAVDMAFIHTMHQARVPFKIESQAFPYPPYKYQEKTHYTMILSMLLPAAIILGYSYMVTTVTTEIVKEHETGVREFMKMLGLRHSVYWFAWFINFFVPAAISMSIIIILLTVNMTGEGAVLVYSSVSVLCVFLFAYLFASVWFILFISTFFNSSGFANSLGVLTWLGSFIIPALLIGNKQRFLGSQLLASILPNMCLYWGFHTIANWESRVMGLKWSRIDDFPSTVESMNMLLIIVELGFDGVFYMVLTIVMRQRGKQGKQLKNPLSLLYDAFYDDTKFPEFIHCLRRGICCCCCRKKESKKRDLGLDVAETSAMGILRSKVLSTAGLTGTPLFNALRFDTDLFEREVLSKSAGIKIRNVSKSYKGETVIKSLSCDFYKSEITVLLGPNGAGKTTLMNILTGMLDAEDGTVYLNRYDIRDYKLDARRSTGLCPQHDMLFEELTVMEHIILFSWLKTGHWYEAKNEAVKLVGQLNLKDEAKTQAYRLSAGQKRKLCFAIAVTGNPKIILLDEVTAGLDSESRKSVWNILQKLREDRTILLTTHSMDEADVLADRIAIMSEGTLKCYGSPAFLRRVYGSGYTVKFRVTDGVKAERLLRIMTTIMPRVDVKNRELSVTGEDISFIIPATYSQLFPDLFNNLFERQEYLGIFAFDVHHTSIEEVFFGVKEVVEFKEGGDGKKGNGDEKGDDKKREIIPPRKVMSILKLSFSRLGILLKKQWWIAQANTVFVTCQFLLPLLLVLSGVTGANRGFRNRDLDHFSEIKMMLDEYEDPVILYNIKDPKLAAAYAHTVGPQSKSTRGLVMHKAVTAIGMKDELGYRNHYIAGIEQENQTLTVMYNSVPYHASSLAINLLTNSLLKYFEPNKTFSILVENHPMQTATKETLDYISEEGVNSVVKSFCFYFSYALAIVTALVALRPLKEKATGSQHLQLMSGTHSFNFWMSYVLFDGLYILILSASALFLVWLSEESRLYTRNNGAVVLFLIFFLSSFACVNFAYFVVHLLKNPGASFGWFNMLHLVAAFGSFIIYNARSGVEDVLSTVVYIISIPFPVPFTIHALHSFARVAIYNSRCAIVANHVLEAICGKEGAYVYLPAYGCCKNCKRTGEDDCFKPMSYFHHSFGEEDLYTISWDLVLLSIMGITYFTLVILIDRGCFLSVQRCCLAAPAEAFDSEDLMDESAAKEAEKVRKLVGLGESVPKETGLLVDGISKNYGNIAAVSNVSFATKTGDCFGILGMNGAGKSSVFQILTGAEAPAVGDVYLLPNSLLGDRMDFLSNLSYCPQKDGLILELTGRQILALYGSLRGLSKDWLAKECQYWLAALGLEHDADRPCRDYSGGMQRRLCVASSLIGDPKVILLDEPTAKVDPAGKRHLWNTLQRLQRTGKIIIVASHNVQECEILCRRVGLMVAGRMRYVDSTTEVKKMFLNGFTVIFRFKICKGAQGSTQPTSNGDGSVEQPAKETNPVVDLRSEIEAIIGECILREAHQNMLRYLIPQRGQNWGDLFRKLETIRTTMAENVESYSINSSSLEEVFSAMADMDADATNVLDDNRVTCLQSCLMGKCCSDDYA